MTAIDAEEMRRRLADMVSALVPLRMVELAGLEPDRLLLHLREMRCTCKQQCRGAAVILGAHGDDLMFAGRHRSEARRALVDGLAISALTAPGGATFEGHHWCANHAECREAEEYARAHPLPPPAPPATPRPIVDVPLPPLQAEVAS